MLNAGFCSRISYKRVFIFTLAIGNTLLENQKENNPINKERKARGRISEVTDIPADFIATISYFSPRLPNVINEESKTARGKANEKNVAEA